MNLRKLVGLAAIGGLLYAHKKRGGQMTLDSFKDTARSLVDDIKSHAHDLKAQADKKMQEINAERGYASPGEDVTGYGSSGYGYPTERH